jgi:ATP-dependent RNA helicase DeaD
MVAFADLTLHPALAAALAARGYQTATPVQAAVLDPACAGRDLLVSSQTGSGKTVAFGTLIAREVLSAQTAPEKGRPALHHRQPRVLVVVPTRELAAQVRKELAWLLHDTGLRLATFTGGTDVGGDRRALKRGVDLAVGTPGRLVDLQEREALDLSQLLVVVLDEADEMLDLGFREDLEKILQRAPAERRTLLFSATLPREIRSLAARYQKNAVPIDPRTGAGLSATSHSDIRYVAHLIAIGDRLPAVVNVLRQAGAGRAIVFCTTRDGVAELHQQLTSRGFQAVALSGERAQAERNRALEALRSGEARVLVATNVAARGLDLPDVELIVHADLPLNADSLTHRSGRTGRAGKKGTSVVIANLAERRKAERLLEAGHVRWSWTPAPDAGSIARTQRDLLFATLQEELKEGGRTPEAAVLARRLLEAAAIEPEELAAALLQRELDRLPAGEPLEPVDLDKVTRDARSGPAPVERRPRADFSRGGAMFRINLGGTRDKADPRWMLPLICRRGGVTRRDVGAIRIGPHHTDFEIAGEAAADFALAASQPDPRAPHVTIRRIEGEAAGGLRPSRPPAGRPPAGRSPGGRPHAGPHRSHTPHRKKS